MTREFATPPTTVAIAIPGCDAVAPPIEEQLTWSNGPVPTLSLLANDHSYDESGRRLSGTVPLLIDELVTIGAAPDLTPPA